MNEKSLFTLNYFEFQCEENLVDEVFRQVTSLDKDKKIYWTGAESNSQAGYLNKEGSESYHHNELLNWVSKCFNEVSQLKYKRNLAIIDSWLTKTGHLSSSGLHDHGMSILSGVLYFADSSPIEFRHDDPFFYHIKFYRDPDTIAQSASVSRVEPKKGNFIIFPSYLLHRVTTNKNKSYRYSLAFNTFFTGEISTVRTARFHLDSKNLV